MIVHLFSLVFQANRLANTVRRYKIIHNFHYIKKFLLNIKFHQGGRPMNAPTGLCERLQYYARAWYVFWYLQTVFTNWVRRLAVRAPDERPYELFCVCTQNKWRSLTAATDDTQPSYKQKWSGNNVLYFANLLPDHNFPFPIFNFTFN